MDRFSDEPFGLCDIQFDYPRIFVEPCPLGEESRDFYGTRRVRRADAPPFVVSVESKEPLENCDMLSAAADDKRQRSAVGIPFPDDGSEISRRLGAAQDSTDFQMRGQ